MLAWIRSIFADQVVGIRGSDLPICTKVIIITDGEPTELELVAGPDIANPRKIEEVSNIFSYYTLFSSFGNFVVIYIIEARV